MNDDADDDDDDDDDDHDDVRKRYYCPFVLHVMRAARHGPGEQSASKDKQHRLCRRRFDISS